MPLHPQAQMLMDGMSQAGGPKLSETSVADNRTAYRALIALAQPEEVARTDDRLVEGPEGDIPVRVYTPEAAINAAPGVMLWFHGGGWVLGDLDTADATCRALANRSGAVVVSVDYRKAPEHRSPAAIDDCMAALQWVVENEELLGIDANKVAVGGDSAGGHLAALVCQRVRDEFGPEVDFQLLVNPVLDLTLSHPSIEENATGYFLTKDTMEWFVDHYLDGQDPADPAVSPLLAASVEDLPPALILTAEFDPLRDEGAAYAARLEEAGVPVELICYEGMMHQFFEMASLLSVGAEAVDTAGNALRKVLS
ncbi:MAG: alpha/beta hydrolase [Actinomycetota bacterium]|nr:alpha/beta hydrolase [Actinomycetota bacterium]